VSTETVQREKYRSNRQASMTCKWSELINSREHASLTYSYCKWGPIGHSLSRTLSIRPGDSSGVLQPNETVRAGSGSRFSAGFEDPVMRRLALTVVGGEFCPNSRERYHLPSGWPFVTPVSTTALNRSIQSLPARDCVKTQVYTHRKRGGRT
jgi:hypothetical protein